MLGPVIAMAIGIIGSSVIHLSKGIMRLGIRRLRTDEVRAAAMRVYAVGIILNFSNPFWVIAANPFAPTQFYTSMYGLGLVALVAFERFFMGEQFSRRQWAGLSLVIAGTLAIGLSKIVDPPPGLFHADRQVILTVFTAWFVVGVLAALAGRRARRLAQELLFGLVGGGMASLDAVLKGVAQANAGGADVLPVGTANWALFALSFLGAAGAFGMIQWSFLRKCRASMMAAAYDVAYVTLPLVLLAAAVPGDRLSLLAVGGLLLLAAGTVGLQLVREERPEGPDAGEPLSEPLRRRAV
jgi:multidrug transporter EmrE-like cation transporter